MSRSPRFLLAVAVAVALFVGCGTSKNTQDASISVCQADPAGANPTAQGSVINTSSKTSSFFIRVGFYDPSGNRVSEGAATIGSVDPGLSANWNIAGAANAKGPLTCEVMTLRRTAVPG